MVSAQDNAELLEENADLVCVQLKGRNFENVFNKSDGNFHQLLCKNQIHRLFIITINDVRAQAAIGLLTKDDIDLISKNGLKDYRIVASRSTCYYSENQIFCF